jgi:hypothetical protein
MTLPPLAEDIQETLQERRKLVNISVRSEDEKSLHLYNTPGTKFEARISW